MLRKPIGPYKVGITNYDTDMFGEGEFRRRLSLKFFYPSQDGITAYPYEDADYQKDLFAGKTRENGVSTYCYKDAVLQKRENGYPVIIYNHGLMGHQMESTVLCADAASSGSIVVSVGHPLGSSAVTYTDRSLYQPPQSFVIQKHNLSPLGTLWEEDIMQAIHFLYKMAAGEVNNIFNEMLNLRNGLHIMGVSFGGCLSVATALKEQKIISAINLDGGLFTKIEPVYKDKPVLVLCSPFNYKAYEKLILCGCSHIIIHKIKKITHWEFSDGIYLSDRGKKNREWADKISRERAELCLSFWKKSEN